MGSFQGGRWTPRQLGLATGGFAGAGHRAVTRRLAQDMAAQRSVTKRGRFIGAQTEMTGSGNLSATDYITEGGIWLVTAHATVRTSTAATGRLVVVAGDLGLWPADPDLDLDISIGGGDASTDAPLSWIVLGGDGYVGGRYDPDTGTVDEAWLVWRAFRLD